MNITVGFIPYFNMSPFHQGFGPESLTLTLSPLPDREREVVKIEFQTVSPRALGLEAEAGRIDAGAMSLVDFFRLSDQFELLGDYGIGVKQAANSVLVFSKKSLSELSGVCAVTDETSTSIRLLQILLEQRYGNQGVSYGRIASSLLFDGEAEALLLIGDEALQARKQGIKGFPVVTDLGEEWFAWQGTSFVFAHWVVRKSLSEDVKKLLKEKLEISLISTSLNKSEYLSGFQYRITNAHRQSMEKFKELITTPSPAHAYDVIPDATTALASAKDLVAEVVVGDPRYCNDGSPIGAFGDDDRSKSV